MIIKTPLNDLKARGKSLALVKHWSTLCWRLRASRANGISRAFWEARYQSGGTSGPGSYGRLAEFKISTINSVIQERQIASILDMGCGDGNQIAQLADVDYLGVDVSQDAVNHCRQAYKGAHNRCFLARDELSDETAEMTMSLDVVYHLVEDPIFEVYMTDLFDRSEKFVLIYSSDFDQLCLSPIARPVHVRHRAFSDWVSAHRPDWKLQSRIDNPYKKKSSGSSQNVSFADFYLYVK